MFYLNLLYQSTLLLELLALITSVLFFNSYRNSFYKYILPFLVFIVIQELAGRVLKTNALTIFNYTTSIEFLFYLWLFYVAVSAKLKRRTIVVLAIIYLLLFIFIFFIGANNGFEPWLFIVGNLSVVVAALFYLHQSMAEIEFYQMKNELLFWIACGCIIFYAGELPIITVSNMMKVNTSEVSYALLGIKFVLSNALYLCYSIGFINLKKQIQ